MYLLLNAASIIQTKNDFKEQILPWQLIALIETNKNEYLQDRMA